MAITKINFDQQVDSTNYQARVDEAIQAVQSDVDLNEADADAAMLAEATARANADDALTEDLTKEAGDRLAGDEAEAAARSAADNQIEVDYQAADAAISENVDQEVNRAMAAEQSNTELITTETAERKSAVTALNSQITAESEARKAAINAEQARAEAAEQVLTDNVASLLANSDAAVTDSIKEVVDTYNNTVAILKTVYASKQNQTAQPDGSATEFMFDSPLMVGSAVVMLNGVTLEEGFDFEMFGSDDEGHTGISWLRGEEGEDGEVSIEAPATGERLMVYGISLELAGLGSMIAPELAAEDVLDGSDVSDTDTSTSTDISLEDKYVADGSDSDDMPEEPLFPEGDDADGEG